MLQAILSAHWWERLLALLRPPVPVPVPVPVPCRAAQRRVLASTTWVAGLLVCLSVSGWSAVATGLSLEVYPLDAPTPITESNDQTINENWGTGAPIGLPADRFGAMWTGVITVSGNQQKGKYTFHVTANAGDAVDLTIGNATTNLTFATTGTQSTGQIQMNANVNLTLIYRHNAGSAALRLGWTRPDGVTEAVVPASRLTPADTVNEFPPVLTGPLIANGSIQIGVATPLDGGVLNYVVDGSLNPGNGSPTVVGGIVTLTASGTLYVEVNASNQTRASRAVIVGNAPVPAALVLSGDEDSVLSGDANAADVNGDALTWTLGTPLPAHGTVVITNAATGTFTYTPHANWYGTDTINLLVSDRVASNPADARTPVALTVPVTVLSVDDPLVVVVPSGVSAIARGDALVPGIVVTDIDAATFTVAFSADTGSVVLPLAGGGSSMSGDTAAVAIALSQVVYRAGPDAGSATITMTANGVATDIPVTVTAVPAVPVASLALTAWDGSTGYAPLLLPEPGRTWTISVAPAQAGDYFVWFRGASGVGRELSVLVDGLTQGAHGVNATMAWHVIGGMTVPPFVALTAGTHQLTISGTTPDVTLEQVMLVPRTPASTTTAENPVMVGLGAAAVIDLKAYDLTQEQSGWSWLPDGGGGLELLPNLNRGDAGTAATRGLSYWIYATHSGTYVVWARGGGPDYGSDSIWLALDGGAPQTNLSFAGSPLKWGATRNEGGVAQLSIPAGLHRLDVRWREDGVRLRQLALAGDPGWIPYGTDLPVSARQGVAAPVDGVITLEAEQTAQILVGRDYTTWEVNGSVPGAVGTVLAKPNLGRAHGDPVQLSTAPGAVWYVRFDQPGSNVVYDLWTRSAGPDGGGDSVWFSLGNAAATGQSITGVGAALPLTWSNRRLDGAALQLVVPAPGIYPLILKQREDGAVIDRILIQPAGGAAPTDVGPPAVPLVSPVTGPG